MNMSSNLLLLGCLLLATYTLSKNLPINSTITCPEGWSPFYASYSCYRYVEKQMNWTDARSFCQYNYAANLVSIESDEENNFIFKDTVNGTWIGLNRLLSNNRGLSARRAHLHFGHFEKNRF